MSVCDNSTSVFTTQHNSPNKAFLLRKAFPPQLNYLLFGQFDGLNVQRFWEKQPGYNAFPQQLGSISQSYLATRLSNTHQLSSSSQCKEKISQSGCAPARGSFHEGFTHLASFSSDFDSQKLTVSKENSDWIENKAKQIIAVVATSQNFFLLIWNRRGGRLINARTGKIWHPKV